MINLIIDYFKPKKNVQEVDLVLVDIKKTLVSRIIECVKKKIDDPDLKYIAISYRWGELNEQQVITPDYIAHITSFHLSDLTYLCQYIKRDSDLCNINFLWIDAISVDQYNHEENKKMTILKMNQIYQKATYILAVPDLHLRYLKKNMANKEILNLIKDKYKKTIYKEIANMIHFSSSHSTNNNTKRSIMDSSKHTNNNDNNNTNNDNDNDDDDPYSFIQELKMEMKESDKENEENKVENKKLRIENEGLKMEMKKSKLIQEKNELKKAYQFLAYLIDDWTNRTWVISESQIAKEKYKKHGIPLKYMFISLIDPIHPFFSYHFEDDNDDQNNKTLTYEDVDDPKTLDQFIKSRFMQRPHLEMILNSNATRNEDRFHATLPLWNKYHHLIRNVSEWNITDMTSVRWKLYEMINDGDLWDKATLLYACSRNYMCILPSFVSQYNVNDLRIVEKCNYNSIIYKKFEDGLLKYISNRTKENELVQMKQLFNEYKMNSKSIWTENLTSIQFDPYRCCLSVKSNTYFIRNQGPADYCRWNSTLDKLSLKDDYEIHFAVIPYFTLAIPDPDYVHDPTLYYFGSNIQLIGNRDENKWIIMLDSVFSYTPEHICADDYTFNIY
ncbi:unnamed protein product [Cunninghamella blakesleeana]